MENNQQQNQRQNPSGGLSGITDGLNRVGKLLKPNAKNVLVKQGATLAGGATFSMWIPIIIIVAIAGSVFAIVVSGPSSFNSQSENQATQNSTPQSATITPSSTPSATLNPQQ